MKDKLVVIVGPTGIGKTSLSIELAKKLNGEIISADSMQIYKYMDIGTAKVNEEEMKGVNHHLIDFIEPDEDFTVADYRIKTKEKIKEINKRNRIPLLVGGTGLYVNSIVYDLNFTRVASDEDIRNRLEKLKDEFGNQYLFNMLKKVDPESAQKINLNDTKRIIRAIEIYEITGKPRSLHNNNFRKLNNEYDLIMIGLNMDRKKLYDRINKRVDWMIDNALIDEVKKLLSLGYSKDLISMQAIGYKEIISYLDNTVGFDRAIEMIKKGSRNYAKRQLTWFRRDKRIKWFDIDEYSSLDELTFKVMEHIRKYYKILDEEC